MRIHGITFISISPTKVDDAETISVPLHNIHQYEPFRVTDMVAWLAANKYYKYSIRQATKREDLLYDRSPLLRSDIEKSIRAMHKGRLNSELKNHESTANIEKVYAVFHVNFE